MTAGKSRPGGRIVKFTKPLITSVVVATLLVSRAVTQSAQTTFDTPKAAADALVKAAESFNVPSLLQILGPASRDLVVSDDSVADKTRAEDFAQLAREKQQVNVDPKNPLRAELVVGNSEWPFPVPLVKRNGKWAYDPNSGRHEILLRRIGENELDAIRICRGYVEAQHQYALEKHDDSDLNEYAQRIISTPGKHDGLAWQNRDGSWSGPVGAGIARALAQGYEPDLQPYHGYYFKVLKGQGPAALMGQMNFVVNGAMIGGFALAAAPAQYRITGVKTFIVSHEGIVYQKDLGPETLKALEQMEVYDPDKTWQITIDEP
jgi:hypothetical protein